MKKIYLPYYVLLIWTLSLVWGQAIANVPPDGDACDRRSTYLYWTGESDSDFFNEQNWRESQSVPQKSSDAPATQAGKDRRPQCLPGANKAGYTICLTAPQPDKDKHPKAGTIDPGKEIDYNLFIDSVSLSVTGEIRFSCPDKGLTLSHAQLELAEGSFSKGVISLQNESTVHYRGGQVPDLRFNFEDAASWVYTHAINPIQARENLANKILSDGAPAKADSNLTINQYYQSGSILRLNDLLYSPLSVFSSTSFEGKRVSVGADTIYSGAAIPEGMNNQVASFILKRGYMATLAMEENGTGKSKVFIASEADLKVDALPLALQGNISFIRVLPWNWVSKKGTGGLRNGVNAAWYYNWGSGSSSLPNTEYVPMTWGAGATSVNSLNALIAKKKVTHLLGFNESDNCEDQSGRYFNLCQPEVAVAYYENLMKTGLRLGSPAPRENGPTTWLKEFTRIAKERDVRFDFVAVHWYDWGSNPASTPNASAQSIFNRFKNYLAQVHSIYNLPIWITEFNANPNRDNPIQEAFLKLALPYLESLDYVERYAYFEPMSQFSQHPVQPSSLLDENGNLTNIGQVYFSQVSTPSIPESTYASSGTLQNMDSPFVPKPTNEMSFEAECGLYLGSQWDIKQDAAASNKYYIQGNPQKPGASGIARQVHFEFELPEADSYRLWLRINTQGAAASARIRFDDSPMEVIGGLSSPGFSWVQVPRFYALQKGKHRLTFEYPNNVIRLDQISLLNTSANPGAALADSGSCVPVEGTWGILKADTIYFKEAETGLLGSSWVSGADPKAIGDTYIKSRNDLSATEMPPGAEGIASYNFSVDRAGEYTIWAKIRSLNASRNALWIAVDNEPFRKWAGLENDLYDWYWKKTYFTVDGENRSWTYFLNQGNHVVKFAYASGGVFIDRVALASTEIKPGDIDPDVLQEKEALEFEAETATLLGSAAIANCANASNGKQVNSGKLTTNGIRFDQIVSKNGGVYQLNISYMSAVTRNFRLFVNGTALGLQTVSRSGGWCYEGGQTADFTISVQLQEGINVIEIRPSGTDAPFIDKIALKKQLLSLEAENARLLGSSAIQNCASSSNGKQVNMSYVFTNGIEFDSVMVERSGNYLLDIAYMSNGPRSVRFFLNDAPVQTLDFASSGEWCFNGGKPASKVIEVTLQAGLNKIVFMPTGSEAPVMDKIGLIDEVSPEAETMITSIASQPVTKLSLEVEPVETMRVYPNPATGFSSIELEIPGVEAGETVSVSIINTSGAIVFNSTLPGNTGRISINPAIGSGMYIVLVRKGDRVFKEKLIVR